jgi:hypothetical protein
LQFHLRGYHPLWPAFPCRSIITLNTSLPRMMSSNRSDDAIRDLWSCNPELSFRIARFRLFRFRSPLLSESRLFSLPPGTEMVHFPGLAFCHYEFMTEYLVFTPDGFLHSEIPGSQTACVSPRRIAAGRVLHRLLAPRHPHACP